VMSFCVATYSVVLLLQKVHPYHLLIM